MTQKQSLRHRLSAPKAIIVTGTSSPYTSQEEDNATSTTNTSENNTSTQNQPKTPYFYRTRESLLEVQLQPYDQVSQKKESPVTPPCERHQYDGFFNLSIVLLGGACAILSVDNLLAKGVLVNLELLKCMAGELNRSYGFLMVCIRSSKTHKL
jgi:hypothetical protein